MRAHLNTLTAICDSFANMSQRDKSPLRKKLKTNPPAKKEKEARDSSPVRKPKDLSNVPSVKLAFDVEPENPEEDKKHIVLDAEYIQSLPPSKTIEEMVKTPSIGQDLAEAWPIFQAIYMLIPSNLLLPYLRLVDVGEQINVTTKGQFQYKVNTPPGYNFARLRLAVTLKSYIQLSLLRMTKEAANKGELAESLIKMDNSSTPDEIAEAEQIASQIPPTEQLERAIKEIETKGHHFLD